MGEGKQGEGRANGGRGGHCAGTVMRSHSFSADDSAPLASATQRASVSAEQEFGKNTVRSFTLEFFLVTEDRYWLGFSLSPLGRISKMVLSWLSAGSSCHLLHRASLAQAFEDTVTSYLASGFLPRALGRSCPAFLA